MKATKSTGNGKNVVMRLLRAQRKNGIACELSDRREFAAVSGGHGALRAWRAKKR
jgi:hypothetical protein